MGATIILVWEKNSNRIGPSSLFRIVEHLPHIISVPNRNITKSAVNGFYLPPVIALRFTGKICFQTIQPCFGFGIPMANFEGLNQSKIIVVIS